MITRFLRDKSGNFALTLALLAPVLMAVAGIGIDYSMLYRQRDELQQVADAAALATVQELTIAAMGPDEIEAVGKEYVNANFDDNGATAKGLATLNAKVETGTNRDSVKVSIEYAWTPFFAQFFDGGVTPIKVSAVGKLAGQGLTCVLGLMPPQKVAKASIHLESKARLQAENCAVYSNSDDKSGLRLDGSSSISASTICSAGGVLSWGKGKSVTDPGVITDCPVVTDPLAGRTNPTVGACDHKALIISKSTVLKPGVYCNGLKIMGSANVTLEKGIYILKDGPLIVTDTATFSGTHVGFYLTGDDSEFLFNKNTHIDLVAPKDGVMAGLLFSEDPNVPYSFDINVLLPLLSPKAVRMQRIMSNDAQNLLGTFHLPRSVLMIDADAPVAAKSAYTAIVVGRLWLRAGPTLVLNSDYALTEVPVPGGLLGTKPVLTE